MKIEPFVPDTYYHVYNRGNNKENIFKESGNYFYFLKLMKKHLLPIAEIYSYCLLPNHFHIILKLKEERELPKEIASGKRRISQPFSNFFNAYAKAFNKKYHRSGSLFQEHLKRKKIETSDYLQKSIIYVNTNSDHHGLGNYQHYPYSSYQSLVSNNETFIEKLYTISLFENVPNFKSVINMKRNSILLEEN